jgi:hypothetical protein
MSEISKAASEAASKVFASMDIKWPTFADKRNVEQVLQKYIDTARQKDAEMIVRLMKQADELMTLRDSLTKQVEELRADKARLDWLDGRMIDGVHVEVWAKGDPEVKVEREAVVYLGTCTARASHTRLAIDAAMRCKDTPTNHPHH